MTTPVAFVHVGTLAAAAAATAVLGAAAWRVRETPGAVPFLGLMAALTVWSGGYLVALTVHPGGRLLWERVQWFGIAFVPVFFLLFALDYLGYERLPLGWLGAALSIVPLATIALVWTNPQHELVWTSHRLVESGGLAVVSQDFGPWYWANLAYSYALIGVGSFLLVRLAVLSDYLYWDQSALLLVGVIVPLAGNGVSVLGMATIPGIDLTPYAFTVTGIAFGNALFRYRLFEIVPATWQIGQETVVGNLDDGVVITDDDRNVVYLNDEAMAILDVELEAVLGRSIQTVIDVGAVDLDTDDALGEVDLGDRTYEVRSSEVRDRHDRRLGYTFVFNDITGRKRRERELERQRDRLRTLDRLNAVIRGVNQELLGVHTREEVREAATDRLAASDLYDAAWIVDESFLDAPALSTDATRSDGGVDGALDRGRQAIDEWIAAESIRVEGEPADVEAGRWTTVPLVYGRTVYGTLVLFSARPDAFGERELAVLDELGESIAHAINAVDKELVLLADTVVELEFATREPAAFLAGVSASAECSLELAGLVPADGGDLVAYVRSSDAPAAAVRDAATERDGVSDPRVIDEGDPGLVECRLAGGSLLFPLREYGANVESASGAKGQCTVVATVSPDADVRTVVERVQRDFPEAELRAKRGREEPAESSLPVPDDVLESLTDRQREVLDAAYEAGYFEWPRDTTGEELAESLDITGPTMQAHLRKAQNRVLGEILADERRPETT